ncbi:MAG: hypothetical protein ACK42L_02455 [Thermoanaerobaculum sp.]
MKLRAGLCIVLVMALRGPSAPAPSRSLPWGLEDLWDQIGFVKNDGQFPPNVRLGYLAGSVLVAFEDSGFTVFFPDGNKESFVLPCSPACRPVPLEPKASSFSWQVGHPHRWRNKIPTYSRLRYEGLANGVTVEFYPRHGDLEFDVLAPSPEALAGFSIRRELTSARSTSHSSKPAFRTTIQHLATLLRPALPNRAITVSYRESTASFHFQLPPGLPAGPVHLDPTVVWGNYWGKGGPFVDVAVANDGAIFLLGQVFGFSLEEPTSPADPNVLLAAIAPDRSRLLWLKVFGGSWSDEPTKLAVDPNGTVYTVGRTVSPDFPITADAFAKNTFGASVGFVVGHTAATGSLVFSSLFANREFVPGNAHISVEDIVVGKSGDLFLAGRVAGGGLPVTEGSPQPLPAGGFDWFVARLAPRATQVRWCTYLGGPQEEKSKPRIALDSTERVLLAGSTYSRELPDTIPPPASYESTWTRAYLARFSPAGRLQAGAFLASNHETDVGGVVALNEHTAALVGVFNGSEFPQKNPVRSANGIVVGMFLARLRFDLEEWEQVTLTSVANPPSDPYFKPLEIVGAAMDSSGTLAVVGNTAIEGLQFPKTYRCHWGFLSTSFVTWFNPWDGQLLEGTYSGPQQFSALGMALGPDDTVYLAGTAELLPDPFPIPGANDPPCYPPCGQGNSGNLVLAVHRGDPPFPGISWASHPREIVDENPVEIELTFRLDRPWPEAITISVHNVSEGSLSRNVQLPAGAVEGKVSVQLFPGLNFISACLPVAISGCCAKTHIELRRPPRVELNLGHSEPFYPGETTLATVSLNHVPFDEEYSVECFADATGVFQVPEKTTVRGPNLAGPYTLEALKPGSTRLWCEARSSSGQVIRSSDVSVTVTWPPPQHIRFLPVASHQPGLDNSRWRTVLSVFNGYRHPQALTLRWLQKGIERSFTVPPKGLLRFDDLLVQAFALAPENSASASVLLVSEGKLTATAQVVNDTPKGTFGQSFLLADLNHVPASTVARIVLPFLKGGERFRSNIGVFSDSKVDGCHGRLQIYDSRGNPVSGYDVNLPPLGWTQFNQVLGSEPNSPTLGYAFLWAEQGSSCQAYVSIVDRRTGDPTTLALPTDWSQGVIPVAAQTPGELGSQWRTELAVLLHNPFGAFTSLRAAFYPQGGGEPKLVDISGPSGTLVHYENVLSTLFGYAENDRVSGFMTFEPRESHVAVRLYNLGSTGTLGQEIPSHPTLTVRTVALPGLVHDSNFRTNLGFFVDPQYAQIITPKAKVTFFDPAGNVVGRASSLDLPPGWSQLNGVLSSQGLAGAGYVTAVVEVTPQAWVYASVVDNKSGDPTLIEADPLCLEVEPPCSFKLSPPPP